MRKLGRPRTSREEQARKVSNALTKLVADIIGDCPECQRMFFFSCEKHSDLLSAYNRAYDFLGDVEEAVSELEVSK